MKRAILLIVVTALAVGLLSAGIGEAQAFERDLLTLFEEQLPWDDFSDMSEDALNKDIANMGALADAYTFIGRESASGEYAYIVGALVGEDPFKNLSSWSVYNDEGFRTEKFFYSDTGDAAFEASGMTILRGDPANIVLVIPERCTHYDVYALYTQLISGDGGYLADASARGVKLIPPEAPYLCVRMYAQGVSRTEYIKLNNTQLNFSRADSRPAYPPAVTGDYAIYLVEAGESAEDAMRKNSAVPAYLVELAREKCGFVVSNPGDVARITSATMRVRSGMGETTQTITDADALKELERILGGAWYSGLFKCPYAGVLTLTMEDGSEVVIHKSVDSCATLIYGSMAGYEITKADNEKLWEIFSEVRLY